MLLVYVDDFKLAARREHHDELWKALRSVIDMDEESEDARFLGCDHEAFEAVARDIEFLLRQRPEFVKLKVGGCVKVKGELSEEAAKEHTPQHRPPTGRLWGIYNMLRFADESVKVVATSQAMTKTRSSLLLRLLLTNPRTTRASLTRRRARLASYQVSLPSA